VTSCRADSSSQSKIRLIGLKQSLVAGLGGLLPEPLLDQSLVALLRTVQGLLARDAKPRCAHPCANCKTTQKKSGPSIKNHRSNMPPENAFTYGLISRVRLSRG
jgi:hypothetical protein